MYFRRVYLLSKRVSVWGYFSERGKEETQWQLEVGFN